MTMQEFPDSQSELLEKICYHSNGTVTAADGIAVEKSDGERGKEKRVEERTMMNQVLTFYLKFVIGDFPVTF